MGLFFVYLKQINVKNVHRVSGARIQTHNLMITSLLPYPLDQDFHTFNKMFSVIIPLYVLVQGHTELLR